jgi:outer membrane biosynthesis protein TonB
MLAMDQGTSIYVLVFNRDGSLAGHPRLVRSSGFDDLDDAALTALTSAVPSPRSPRTWPPS